MRSLARPPLPRPSRYPIPIWAKLKLRAWRRRLKRVRIGLGAIPECARRAREEGGKAPKVRGNRPLTPSPSPPPPISLSGKTSKLVSRDPAHGARGNTATGHCRFLGVQKVPIQSNDIGKYSVKSALIWCFELISWPRVSKDMTTLG